jgi:hypothetical protein
MLWKCKYDNRLTDSSEGWKQISIKFVDRFHGEIAHTKKALPCLREGFAFFQ